MKTIEAGKKMSREINGIPSGGDAQPRVYGGARVPHWEQYCGLWAMPVDLFDQQAARIAAIDPAQHLAETRAERASRIEAGDPARTLRDDAELDAHGYKLTEDGIAVVDLVGTMTKYGGSFAAMPGGLVGLRRTLRSAAIDPKVSAIVLRIDSPGGNVAGTGDLAGDVRGISALKPVVAFIEDIGASAAYYVASQADLIVATKDSLVGSIGVYMVIDDWSSFFAQAGVKRRVIKYGEHKGDGTQGTEITAAQMDDFQRVVEEIGGVFVDAVAAGRKISREAAMKLADGRIHGAAQALGLGLIDRIGTQEQALAAARSMAAERNKMRTPPRAAARINKETTMGTETDPLKAATVQELKKAIPDSTADFREKMVIGEATLADAQEFWAEELRGQLKAAQDENTTLKAAAKKPGTEPVISTGKPAGASSEQELIDQAVKAQGGSYRKGLEFLQKNLMRPRVDAGMTPKAAAAQCAQEYPLIFGVAA